MVVHCNSVCNVGNSEDLIVKEEKAMSQFHHQKPRIQGLILNLFGDIKFFNHFSPKLYLKTAFFSPLFVCATLFSTMQIRCSEEISETDDQDSQPSL